MLNQTPVSLSLIAMFQCKACLLYFYFLYVYLSKWHDEKMFDAGKYVEAEGKVILKVRRNYRAALFSLM